MIEQDSQGQPQLSQPGDQTRRSQLSRILTESPEARPQLRRAVGSLIGVFVAFLAVLGILLIWHLRRRAQLIRDRLGPPRKVALPDLSELREVDPSTN